MTREEAHKQYSLIIEQAQNDDCVKNAVRYLCKNDLFFLLVYVLGRKDLDRDWLYDRCSEVFADPNGRLDLWFRYAGKSSIITFGKTIQDILIDPEITVCILSYNRPTAKAFLNVIKREFESNELLLKLFDDIFWENTNKAPVWSLDSGIVVKRKTNPKEQTIEAYGCIDAMPTGRHYKLMVYDDLVTKEAVTTTDMINKVTESWQLSRALTTEGGVSRYIGTRYNYNDTYSVMMAQGSVIPRIYPVTDEHGNSVLLSNEQLDEARRDMGSYVFAAQMHQDPRHDDSKGFRKEDLRTWYPTQEHASMLLNKIILVDPANAKKKDSDYTSMIVIGTGSDDNYYIVDMVHDRLNLTERTEALFNLHRHHRPKTVYYERYGMMSDIQHITYVQNQLNYRFDIKEVGGKLSKTDRIDSLIPLFESHRIYLPDRIIKVDYTGSQVDLTKSFIDEYLSYPYSTHDDQLDCLARINDDVVNVYQTSSKYQKKTLKVKYR